MNLTIEVRAKPEKFQELYQTLQALLPTMRRENGCLESRIYGMWRMARFFPLRCTGTTWRNLKTTCARSAAARFSELSTC